MHEETLYSDDCFDEQFVDKKGNLLLFQDEYVDESAESIFGEEDIIDAAFEYYRRMGFPYWKLSRHVCMQEINNLARTPVDKLLKTVEAYHVADTYNPHRFHGYATGMRAPYDSFNDDKQLRRALTKHLQMVGDFPKHSSYISMFNLVSGTQACSNFRPGFACYLYKTYCKPGDVVLDCSMGYGGRLVGFIAANLKGGRYIGIDPNTLTFRGNMQLADDLNIHCTHEMYNSPAEEVDAELLRERCDFSFTSPPYFCKEIYSAEDTQSCNRYTGIEAWVEGFLRPFFKLQYTALKEGSTAIVNIADVNIKNKRQPLVKYSKEIGVQTGFKFVKQDMFVLQHRFGSGNTEPAYEPVLVFKKEGA